MDDFWPNLTADKYARLRIQKSIALAKIEPHMSVLDVGCHKKELWGYIPVNIKYTGIDHLNGYDFDGGFNLNEKFDRIFCLEVLEHLKFPKKTLKSIVDHLKSDGIAIISLPNEASLFHRVRSLFGIVDQECFSESGKHLHLPSFQQARDTLSEYLDIVHEAFYISDGNGSRVKWIQPLLRPISPILQVMANLCPSLFSRGFIFICRKQQLTKL